MKLHKKSIYLFLALLVAASHALAGPYDCSMLYKDNIELKNSYLEQLFIAEESPNLVHYLAQFEQFEKSDAPIKHKLTWRRARLIRALSDPNVSISAISQFAKSLAPLNFQIGDYSPIRAALECGSIEKIKLVLSLNGYRDYDIFDGLDGKPTREFILVRTLLERKHDALEILKLFDKSAFATGVIREIQKNNDLLSMSSDVAVREFIKDKLALVRVN